MEYPERLSRLSTAFRIILVIPVLIFVGLVAGGSLNFGWRDEFRNGGAGAGLAGGSVIVAIWAAVLVRGRIPHWLFDFQVGVNRFVTRAGAYAALLTDRYPAFEGEWVLTYEVDYPDRVSRWRLFFWKLITSIPHFIVLFFLSIAALVVVIIAWFAILFTGEFPRGLHSFVLGVLRWWARVQAYFQSLTDVFPPFSLEEDAGAGDAGTYAASAAIGSIIAAAGLAGGIAVAIFLAVYLNQSKDRDVAYSAVLAADVPGNVATVAMDDVRFTLTSGDDPAEPDFMSPRTGRRIVSFTLDYARLTDDDDAGFRIGELRDEDIDTDTIRLRAGGKTYEPVLLTFDGIPAPIDLSGGATGAIVAWFEVDREDEIDQLRAYPSTGVNRHITWKFE
jgi:hypothetical protein